MGVDAVGRKLGVSPNLHQSADSSGIEMMAGSPSPNGKSKNETLGLLTAELGRVASGIEMLKGSVDRLGMVSDAGKSEGCLESIMAMIAGGGGNAQYGALHDTKNRHSFDADEDDGGEGAGDAFTIT
jgi:hypothetical protein